MQKSILLHLHIDGGSVTVGADHFVLAFRDEKASFTTVVFETFSDEDGTLKVTESPEEIHEQINSLKG